MADKPLFPDLNGGGLSIQPIPTPTTETTAPPAATKEASASQVPVPDLFEDTPKPTTETEKASPSGMVDAALAKDDHEKILGPKPKISEGLDYTEGDTGLGSLILRGSILFALIVYGFFATQLSANFQLLGQNPAQKLVAFESSVKEQQTEVNLSRLMISKFSLDEFNLTADTFLLKNTQYESEYTSNNTKAELENELETLQEAMKMSLADVREQIIQPLYPKAMAFDSDLMALENDYTLILKNEINRRKQELDPNNPDHSVDLNNLNSVLALLNAKSFQTEIRSIDLSKDLSPMQVQHLFQEATKISKNEFSTILNIKSARVAWSDVLDELKTVTQSVDPLYGSGIRSNIAYQTLTFNASDQTITLRGATNTEDSRNFTLVTNLIDGLEKSERFMDVSDRTFNKTEGASDTFTSSFTINLKLQYEPDDRDERSMTQAETESESASEPELEATDTNTTSVSREEAPESSETLQSSEAPQNSEEADSSALPENGQTHFLGILDAIRVPRQP